MKDATARFLASKVQSDSYYAGFRLADMHIAAGRYNPAEVAADLAAGNLIYDGLNGVTSYDSEQFLIGYKKARWCYDNGVWPHNTA